MPYLGTGNHHSLITVLRYAPALILLCACNTPPPPNIILIMADDMGYETLGANGGLSYDTPHLDSLARAGMRFTHVFSTPLCTPSRVQVMTGKYNFRNYIGFGLLDPSERTFAHLLRESGYATGIVGKWQLYGDARQRALAGRGGSDPDLAGFDEFALWQYRERGYRYKSPTIHYSGQQPQAFPDAYGPDLFTEYIEDFLERHRHGPFLLYYPMALPHDPFLPTPAHPDYVDMHPDSDRSDPKYFAAHIEYVDTVVGRIANQLHLLGLDRRTLLLFTTDNGTARNITSRHRSGDIRGRKGYPVAAGIHVPMIAYWPGTVAEGSVNDALIDFTDILPTLVEAVRGTVPADFTTDGVSFLGQLTGRAETSRKWIYGHYDPKWGNFAPARYAQDRQWKLYADGRFYNWINDPSELSPLQDAALSGSARAARDSLQAVIDRMPGAGLPH